jgi:hypothetical protein
MTTNKLQEFLAPINKDYPDKEALIEKAIIAIDTKRVHVLGFSGKKASGKDTFAGMFMERFEKSGLKAEDVPLSLGIRAEATMIFAEIQSWLNRPGSGSQSAFVAELAEKTDMEPAHAEYIVETMLPLIKAQGVVTGWARDNEITAVLQFLGNEVRLPKDQLYWVRKSLWTVAVNAVNGVSSFNPSLRFVHDADSLKDVGGYLIRLEVDPSKQAERLLSRDGVVVPTETLNHPSETALDAYKGFDGVYENNGDDVKPVFKQIWTDWAKDAGHFSRIL